MKKDDSKRVSRRKFLQAGIAASTLSGCTSNEPPKDPEPNAEQISRRRVDPSTVAIIPCPSYEHDPLPELKKYAGELGLPDLKNKSVLLKPNMVEYRDGKPLTTEPAIIKVAVELLSFLGAKKVVVADGPAEFRDTEYLLKATGIGPMCAKLGVPFVDLNMDSLVSVDNTHGFTPIKTFLMPKSVMEADCVVSLPKLKTHQWAGMTCSMKNLFGTVPGRKYGWPKNILHTTGVDICIMDIIHMVKPRFALVDAVVSMEGNGPLSGYAKETGFIVAGSDVAAVDATCARTMEFDPQKMLYMRLANKIVGNTNIESIKILGAPIQQVAQKFVMADTWKSGKFSLTGLGEGT
ncbi:MAG: DUF362 domain-containing protein [Candidatus Obscuribacterales bacterium]|nr:DUF362 domain-containing protein [Candidatus Obscuribacterales bacterium]